MAIIDITYNEEVFLRDHPLAKVQCPVCGEEYLGYSKHSYCSRCGIKMISIQRETLQIQCSRCNVLSPKDASYCRFCGKKLGGGDKYIYDAKVITDYGKYVYLSNPSEAGGLNYEFVDLGLSVFWGREPLSSGKEMKKTIWMNDLSLGYRDFSLILDYSKIYNREPDERWFRQYDVINSYMRGECRAPQISEMEELVTRCIWKPETRSIQSDAGDGPQYECGFRVTGPSGNSVFIQEGRYWTSTNSGSNNAYALCVGGRIEQIPESRRARFDYRDKEGTQDAPQKNWEEMAKAGALFYEIRALPILLPINDYKIDSRLVSQKPANAGWLPVMDK